MEPHRISEIICCMVFVICVLADSVMGMSILEKRQLKEQVKEMFWHAYGNYMKHAYPADELMPLSCRGRYRETEPSRGDIDDTLGNFSLTLVDTLDTLAVIGEVEEFERAVKKIIKDLSFDNDLVVSVFETNIRILGGLLGGHVAAKSLQNSKQGMVWYRDELLDKAKDIGYRLLPAFNTTTGIPFPRVNLKHGLCPEYSRTGQERDTCTACAGTMILEFAALSRLTGEPIFEAKAQKAMEFLYHQRHRSSDLVGTVINIHDGNWVRRESGVGAGIDSYYEYMLKAYILLGDEAYLDRFNKHYSAIMKYINQGPMMMDVHMHRPNTNSRNFMDSLLAFWPGLQVLKGDIKPAIEIHEMLYQVMQRHNFLPEAFTTDFRVHWGQHPLRPEFVESTYFIFKATGDPYYLEVGKQVLQNLNQHARVPCGFAAIRDVTSGVHEDQMDSYVLAETFKYLYLLFAEESELVLNVDDYVFTTEAHLLPLSLAMKNFSKTEDGAAPDIPDAQVILENDDDDDDEDEESFHRTCPNTKFLFPGNADYAHTVRKPLKDLVENLCPKPKLQRPRLRAGDFIAGNVEHLEDLKRMGIRLVTMKDGRIQLLHTASEAVSPVDAEDGMQFMQEMIELSKNHNVEVKQEPRSVQLLSQPYFGYVSFSAGPAQFGVDLREKEAVIGPLVIADPYKACSMIDNPEMVKGRIVVMERGDCMFIDKARNIQSIGAIGGIVIDNHEGTTSESAPLFAMSGDGKNDVTIPIVFLFHKQGQQLFEAMAANQRLLVRLGYKTLEKDTVVKLLVNHQNGGAQTQGEESGSPPEDGATGISERDQALSRVNQLMGLAGLTVHMDIPGPNDGEQAPKTPVSNDDNIIKVIRGPDNTKSVRILLRSHMTTERKHEAYRKMIALLREHTNFKDLANQGEYMIAISRLLQAALSDGEKSLDGHSEDALTRLVRELQPASTPRPSTNKNPEDLFSLGDEEEREDAQSEEANVAPQNDQTLTDMFLKTTKILIQNAGLDQSEQAQTGSDQSEQAQTGSDPSKLESNSFGSSRKDDELVGNNHYATEKELSGLEEKVNSDVTAQLEEIEAKVASLSQEDPKMVEKVIQQWSDTIDNLQKQYVQDADVPSTIREDNRYQAGNHQNQEQEHNTNTENKIEESEKRTSVDENNNPESVMDKSKEKDEL